MRGSQRSADCNALMKYADSEVDCVIVLSGHVLLYPTTAGLDSRLSLSCIECCCVRNGFTVMYVEPSAALRLRTW